MSSNKIATSTVNRELEILSQFAETERIKSSNDKEIQLFQIQSNEKIALADINAKKDFYSTIGMQTVKKYVFQFVLTLVGVATIVSLALNGHKDLVIPLITFLTGMAGGFGMGKSSNANKE